MERQDHLLIYSSLVLIMLTIKNNEKSMVEKLLINESQEKGSTDLLLKETVDQKHSLQT